MDISLDSVSSAGIVIGVWVVLGSISSIWMYFQAQAAVKVRPNLVDVSLFDAFLTGHGFDWLFYKSPLVGVVVVFALYGVVSVIFLWQQ